VIQYQRSDNNGHIGYAASAPKTMSFNKAKSQNLSEIRVELCCADGNIDAIPNYV